jgi:hypothetical protein
MVVAAWLAVGGGAAWATTGHTFVGQFGGLGSGDGQFGEPNDRGPSGVAVMPSTGDVFTADAAQAGQPAPAPRVQRFSADGVFASAFAIEAPYSYPGAVAVDPAGSGAVYVAANRAISDTDPNPFGVVVKYSPAGAFAYELDASTSETTINNPLLGTAPLAIDPVDGTVYAAATGASGPVIDRFDGATGEFIDSFDGSDGSPDGGFQCLSGLAVDVSHQVYVLDSCKNGVGRVDRYSAGHVFEATISLPLRPDPDLGPETPSAVATDPNSGEVYVGHSGPVGLQITHLAPGGASVVYTFDASEVGGIRGMAISGAGTVYTSDFTRPFVQRFAPFDGPTVVTGAPPLSPGVRSAVLEGTINPEGATSSYHFEYGGTDLTFGSRTSDVAAGGGSGVVAASASVDGLQPNKNYVFRIVGSNDSGSIAGAPVPFTTAPAPATVDGTPPAVSPPFVSAITPRTVRLHGTVNPNNASSFTTYKFEYGTTTAYGGTATSSSDFGFVCGLFGPCGGVDRPVAADVAGLQPATTYHFRVVASNSVGDPQGGADQTFVTSPAAGSGATEVTAGRARLTGTINPHGVATSYHFNYGLTSSYGSSTSEVDGGSGDGDQLVATEISGLSPDTTYHVQVVATNADGVVRASSDGLFRTMPAPTAEVTGPTGVSTDTATVTGNVTTFGLPGSYHFDVWSLNGSYAVSTPERPAAGNASVEHVSATLTGLPADETFVVQLTVTSNDAISRSDLLTLATAPVPSVFPPSPDVANVYGCGSPRLDAYRAKSKPGATITITGQDLGIGGTAVLGDRSLEPTHWSSSGFRVSVPKDAAGTLALTVNCGHRSNTIAVAVFQEPDNRFAVTGRSVSGSTATLQVNVPGPGKLASSGAGSRAAKVTIKRPGAASIKVRLSRAGVRALGRSASRTRKVKVRVRFTPAGGRAASKTVTITFKRKGGR